MTHGDSTRELLQASIRHVARGAFTLLELMTVVVILGLLALAAAGAFRPETIGDLDGQVTAQRLAWDLRRARQNAIALGDNHALVFTSSSGKLTGYTLHRRLANNSLTPVDAPVMFANHVTVNTATTTPEFTFEGDALAGYTFTITTPHKNWSLTVAQATGSVQVQ